MSGTLSSSHMLAGGQYMQIIMDQSSNSLSSATDFGGPSNAVLNAFGTVLGYIGAEAATCDIFERLLWPKRFYSGFTFSNALKVGLFMSMGGPLYKVCLETLDVAFEHGLFRGHNQGHMLNTAFFRRESWTYTLHSSNPNEPSHTESVRNCLWVRALAQMPMPMLDPKMDADTKDDDSTKDAEKAATLKTRTRAKVSLCHLTLSRAEKSKSAENKAAVVPEDTEPPTARVYTALFISEISGVIVAIIVGWVLNSSYAVLWLCPLLLKLLSATFTLRREPLTVLPDPVGETDYDVPQDFEIHCPTSNGNFILITGPPALVLQFFRHYGHPIRNRMREIIQLAIVVAYGCLFPVGLLCSVAGMSIPVQYAWVLYQMYAVLVMYISRYTHARSWVSTEEIITRKLSDDSTGRSVIFGGDKNDGRAVFAHLDVTYHNRYSEGRDHMTQLLNRYSVAELNSPRVG